MIEHLILNQQSAALSILFEYMSKVFLELAPACLDKYFLGINACLVPWSAADCDRTRIYPHNRFNVKMGSSNQGNAGARSGSGAGGFWVVSRSAERKQKFYNQRVSAESEDVRYILRVFGGAD